MPFFRKKPVEVQAWQWSGEPGDLFDMLVKYAGVRPAGKLGSGMRLIIPTLEGDVTATVGDWIVMGIKGEFYPVKPDIFSATYEEVDESDLLSNYHQRPYWPRSGRHG